MRLRTRFISTGGWLAAAFVAAIPLGAHAQLEEIIVTATRRETSLQVTPISVQAFTSEQLELGGIERGADIGIMVPNVVLNPSTGATGSKFFVRGLPGVGIYIDGVWQGGTGFQQTNFLEMERIEVLRGPQGTLFGRNTNGGAVNMTTRRPGDVFGARLKLDVGEFNRRNASIAVDLPITDTLKTKFMGATLQNDGFLQGLTTPWDFGAQDDTLMRIDVLWEPTDTFSLRATLNDEEKRGTDPRIHEMTRYANSKTYAYNIMLGAFQSRSDAACAANPGFVGDTISANSCAGGSWPAPPPPPQGVPAFGERYTGEAQSEYTPTSHTTNFQGGRVSGVDFAPGTVGKWETRSDSMQDGVEVSNSYLTLNADWEITDNINFEAIVSTWEQDGRTVIDFDGTEFLGTTDDRISVTENETFELHLSGSTDNGRINWLAGYYSLETDYKRRFYRWAAWEFTVPNVGPGDPQLYLPYNDYVRDTARLIGLNGEETPPGSGVFSGGNMQTPLYGGRAPPGSFPYNRAMYQWNLWFISGDRISRSHDEDSAFFGEATFSVTDRLDLTFGARQSDKTGWQSSATPTDAFRTPDPDIRPQGDLYAFTNERVIVDAPQPKINTYKFAAQYQFTDELMMYASYAEGFTQGESDISTIGDAGVPPPGCTRVPTTTDEVSCDLKPEVIETMEIGLRSDWLDGRLRFNATYFDADWTNMRIVQLPFDSSGNTQPYPYDSDQGAGTADGFEFELVYVPTDRLQLNFGLGLIDTNYIQSGVFDGLTGNFPGAPFAYAPETSATVGVSYDIPFSNGGHILLIGNYGYMDDYARDAAYQRTKIDENGLPVQEPGYGIVNARLVYEPADRNYSVELWGRNLTDSFYVNGGFDTHDTWGYDFSIIGRAREVGVSLGFEF